MKRALIVLTLVALVALPFALRPKADAARRTDDTVVVITPHNEAIRHEYALGFAEWYQRRTGRSVSIDWRIVGGTSEIARFLEGEFSAAFELQWVKRLGRAWSAEVASGFQNGRLRPDAPAAARDARAAFLASEVGCGIDVFFGGGTYDFERAAQAGWLVETGLKRARPEWFTPPVIPESYAGETYRDAAGRWVGAVLSSYGIIFNRDSLGRLGVTREPSQWADLADPRLVGEVALADPTKSGSVAKAFENIIQQQMQLRLEELARSAPAEAPAAREQRAVREGWLAGMQLLQRIGANSRYFTDSSQKPPIDVASGNCAAGLCIDFYGRQQQEAVRRRDRTERVGYVSPAGGSVASVDPIALLRGARNRAAAEAFLEYVLSPEGQLLWNLRPGTSGGPRRFALRRLPVRRDFYRDEALRPLRSDPDDAPYDQATPLVYRQEWTGRIFREMALIIRVMCQDTHAELRAAWTAIQSAEGERKARALAAMQDLSVVAYEKTTGTIRERMNARNRVDEAKLARELADAFRGNYRRAEAIARGDGS